MLPERAAYEISDNFRRRVAEVKETKGRSVLEALAQEVPNVRTFAVTTPLREPLLTLVMRGEWLAEVSDAAGRPVGRIRVAASRRQYTLLDDEETVAGEAAGDLSLTKFTVSGSGGEPYAKFRKTWAGLSKEIFTQSDNYKLTVTGLVPPRLRPLIVLLPVVVDISVHGPY